MAKKVYKTSRKYQCPYCEKRLPRMELIDHVARKHEELIPENYSASRVVYESINKTDHGTCMICKKPVYEWNEKTSRYNNLCNNPHCREEVRRIALERHIKTYNAPTLLNNPEHQEKMLANRHISGRYKYSDGTIFTYTGKYEKSALEFMDKVMNISSKDIQMPGPILEYEYNGEKHSWITDIYYIPANLIIEVKDGGNNPNNRNMPEYRGKQKAKEVMITELGKFNYLRLTNNYFSQLLEALAEIKYENMDQKEANHVNFFINESVLHEVKYENDKGEKVPKKCPKCGADVKVFLRGEPVFLCSNKDCNKYFGTVPFNESAIHEEFNDEKLSKSNVYFTKEITPESLVNIFDKLGVKMKSKTCIKISTGEPGKGPRYCLSPDLIKNLVEHVDGTICECNVAYEGPRHTSEEHWKTIKKHGYYSIATCDILDEDGDYSIEVQDGHVLKFVLGGTHMKNYDNFIILSHFKGHAMGGYGGALKNVAIGLSSANGKKIVHSGGHITDKIAGMTDDGKMDSADKPIHDIFLKSMADANKAFGTEMKKNGGQVVYINIANNISVDCDCDPEPSAPTMKDIGIFASLDPVAVDQAGVDAIYAAPDGEHVIHRIEERHGLKTLDYAAQLGIGNRDYNLINIDGDSDYPIDEAATNYKLYRLATKNMDGQILNPSIPDNFLTKNGFEDDTNPRVCFATDIDSCLRALSMNLTGKEYFVHVPDGNFDSYKPSKYEVPDVNVINERWIRNPVKVKCIGKIKVSGDKGEDGIPYTYGNGKYKAELYDWNWKWVEKYNSIVKEEVGGLPPRRASTTWIEPYMMNNTFDVSIGNDASDTVFIRDIDDNFKAITRKEFGGYDKPGEALVYKGDDAIDVFENLSSTCKTFTEMLYKVAGYKFRVIDELALMPNWYYWNGKENAMQLEMTTAGVVREFDILSGKIKVGIDKPIKKSVLLSMSDKGYFIHTPKDYYLASDFYDSVEEIPQNVIDIMADLYDQHKKRNGGDNNG